MGFAALAAVATVAVSVGEATAKSTAGPGSTHFPRYKELEPNVAFWSDVFTKWSSKQIAFHDVEHLDLVYSVLSISDIFQRLPQGQQEDAVRARRKAEGERITAMLLRIADGHARTEEERRILKAMARVGLEPSYAQKLSEQVRSQRGLGDKFCEAAERAEKYRPMMSEVLRSYGVPVELLALPIVESGYQIGAHSSAGAAGIWQFMPATGRMYLEVGSAYDDRRDPRRSTDAAARMLRKTYDTLGSWPLAITSYNHGPGGIARAVKEMGTTHFGVISRHYKGKAFGFASRNYYAEFLAAVDAMARLDVLCGDLNVQPYAPDEALLSASASIRDLARAAGMSVEALDDLNPALSDSVSRGSVKVPRGYRLNLPRGTRDEFASNFGHVDRSAPTAPTLLAGRSAASEAAEPVATASATVVHRVKKGETLGQIARKFGTTETTLLYMNRLRSASALRVGQNLKIPADRATAPVAVAEAKIAHPPFSRTMTTNAGIVAAKEAGQAAAAATLAAKTAAKTAAVVVPAAVIRNEEAPAAVAKADAASADAAGTVVASVPDAGNGADPAAATAAAGKEPAPAAGEEAVEAETETVLTTEHKVGRGQTLSQIASMYHTSVEDLKSRNGITEAASIRAGQVLKVRSSGSAIVAGATVGRTYKVRSGDTLWTVARANDTSVETLKRLNPRIAASGLRAGDSIKVPSAGAVSVASATIDDEAPKKSASSKSTPATKAATAKVTASKATASKATAGKTSGKATAKVTAKAPSKAPTKVAKSSFRNHRVQKGQTLTSIAQKYSTSVETLKRINGIRDAHSVQVGKTLKVPL